MWPKMSAKEISADTKSTNVCMPYYTNKKLSINRLLVSVKPASTDISVDNMHALLHFRSQVNEKFGTTISQQHLFKVGGLASN